jgi:putative DNA primase/helicase
MADGAKCRLISNSKISVRFEIGRSLKGSKLAASPPASSKTKQMKIIQPENPDVNEHQGKLRVLEPQVSDVVQSDTNEENLEPALQEPQFSTEKVLSLLSASLPDQKIDDLLADGVERSNIVLVVTVVGCVLDTTRARKIPLIRFQDGFYIFNGHNYVKVEADDLKEFLGVSALKMGVTFYTSMHFGFRDQLAKQFQSQAYFPAPAAKKDDVLVNLLNGTLLITPESRCIMPHDSSRPLFYVLPYDYDPAAKAPKWQNFLDEVLSDRTKQMVLAEFMATSFISPRVIKVEKAMILFGSGANGKSVIFEVLTEILGQQNVSNYSLTSLSDEKGYHRAELTGKRMNWATEISTKMNTAMFKALASREPIEARRPYGSAFIQDQIPPMVFNTNVLPRDVEHNSGFFRRFLIIDFPITIPPEKRNPSLAKEIIDTELPGVLNWVLEGMNRLLNQKGLTKSPSIENALNEYRKTSCSVSLFIEDIGFKPSSVDTVSLKELFRSYRQFCNENGLISVSTKTFSERLAENKFTVHRKNYGRIVYGKMSVYK